MAKQTSTLTAKQALLQFLDKHGLRSGLKMEVQNGPPPPAPPFFTCIATVPVFEPKAGSFVGKAFQGEAKTKKAAEHAASRRALDYIDSQGLLPELLKDTVPLVYTSPAPAAANPAVEVKEAADELLTSLLPEEATAKPGPDRSAAAQPAASSNHEQQAPAVQPPEAIPAASLEIALDDQEQAELAREAGQDLQDQSENGHGLRMPNVVPGVESEIEFQLGNRKLLDLTPTQLKEELQKALNKNTELKGAIHHEQQRREKALDILLGLS